ncbi:MAG: hypothetical protein IPL25_10260 [Saprospiraceae bacterium]|nr:hypothetical protein [Candidatus Vicinibacter affinis]
MKRDFPKSALISELNRQTTGSLSKQKLVQEEYGDTTKMAISNYSYMGAKDVIDNPKLGAEVKAEKIEVMQKICKIFLKIQNLLI